MIWGTDPIIAVNMIGYRFNKIEQQL